MRNAGLKEAQAGIKIAGKYFKQTETKRKKELQYSYQIK